MAAAPPLVAHVIYRLDFGGLENGLVNLINRMPAERYRHAIICLTGYSAFAQRIQRQDVSLHALNKRPGKDFPMYLRLWRLLRRLHPDIIHTRNLAALDSVVAATLAGVPRRVHGEHGWDIYDLDGTSVRYNRLRRFCRRFVHRYIPMSRHLAQWLASTVGVPRERIRQIYSGVDSTRFRPRTAHDVPPWPAEFAPPGSVVIGSVGRMEPVKDQQTLARAFVALKRQPGHEHVRLVLIGEGPERSAVNRILEESGLAGQAWVPGARDDVPEVMRALDVFVLPSLNEGISNTLLEAMASGVAVVATLVGGNVELIDEGSNGHLCPAADPAAMATVLASLAAAPGQRSALGRAGRERVERSFSMGAMVGAYTAVYDEVMREIP